VTRGPHETQRKVSRADWKLKKMDYVLKINLFGKISKSILCFLKNLKNVCWPHWTLSRAACLRPLYYCVPNIPTFLTLNELTVPVPFNFYRPLKTYIRGVQLKSHGGPKLICFNTFIWCFYQRNKQNIQNWSCCRPHLARRPYVVHA